MSLHDLSTEIDMMIIKLLPVSDAFHLALTSKYYSQLALPNSSRTVHVYKYNPAALSKLVYRLIKEPYLATRLHAVNFLQNPIYQKNEYESQVKSTSVQYNESDTAELRSACETRIPSMLFRAAGEIRQRPLLAAIKCARCGALIAFVLGASPNLKYIRLRFADFDQFTNSVFNSSRLRTSSIRSTFHQLKHLKIESCDSAKSVLYLPVAKKLQTLYCKNVIITDTARGPIRNLELHRSRFDRRLSFSQLRRYHDLTRLKIHDDLEYKVVSGSDWLQIATSLGQARGLQSLDIQLCYNGAHREELYDGLRALASFGRLETLRIPMNMVFDDIASEETLPDILPSSLIDLELYITDNWKSLPQFCITEVIAYRHESLEVPNLTELASFTITQVIIGMRTAAMQIAAKYLEELHNMKEELDEVGVDFRARLLSQNDPNIEVSIMDFGRCGR